MTSSVGRPRSAGRRDLPDNLTPRTRGGVTYWYWRDPRDGIEKSLKCPDDRETAIRRTKELNALVAGQIAGDLVLELAASPKKRAAIGTPFNNYALHYYYQLVERGKLAKNTLRSRKSQLNTGIDWFQVKPLHEIGVDDCSNLLKSLILQGKSRMAQAVRSTIIDMFKEAHEEGLLPASHPNPMEITRRPAAKVKRARLTLGAFNAILQAAHKIGASRGEWVPNSMLLALLTGQRREDLVIAQFKRGRDWPGLWLDYQTEGENYRGPHPYPHVHEGFFWVVQKKTGALVKIPLTLKLNVMGLTVADVIDICRSKVASRFLLHHTIVFSNAPLGSQISIDRVSTAFADARNKTDLVWPGKEPATYHEIRSLSERLYGDQGIDTQSLLGHKHAKMTEVYADPRQAEWLTVT
jgi:integrase